MAYIPVAQELPRHRKTIALGEELRQHRWYAAGLLEDVWGWALDHAKDGYVRWTGDDLSSGRGHLDSLARHLGLRRNDTRRVLEALAKVGWIDPDSRLHEWERWGGKVVQALEEDAVRKKLWREHKKGVHVEKVPGCRTCARIRPGGHLGGRPGGHTDEPNPMRPLDVQVDTEDASTWTSRGIRARATEIRAIKEPPTPTLSFGQDASASETLAKADLLVATASEPWASALRCIRERTSIANFVTWYGGTRLEGDHTVVCSNAFTREWLEKHYAQVTADALGVPKTGFVLEGDLVASGAHAAPAEQPRQDEQEPPIPDDDDG